jgi:hypothetical protein
MIGARAAPIRFPALPSPLADDEMAFLRAVVYASLFDYPLTLAQALETLVGSRDTEAGLLAMYHSSPALQTLVEYRRGLFFVRGADRLVLERARRERASRSLLADNRRLLKLICAMPFTSLVALSGSAAHLNVGPAGGDVDLFVVTRRRQVWSVAVAIRLLAWLLRRGRTLSANFVLADTALALDPGEQDLFCANQIVHLRPLAGGAVYCRFVEANPFVERYYPNFEADATAIEGFAPAGRAAAVKRTVERLLAWGPSRVVEQVCRLVLARRLRRGAATWSSPEQVRLSADCLKLHPHSPRQSILARYDAAVDRALAQL